MDIDKLPETDNIKTNYYTYEIFIPFYNKISLSDDMFPKNTSCEVKILNVNINPLMEYSMEDSNIKVQGKINYKIASEFTFLTPRGERSVSLILSHFALNLDRYLVFMDSNLFQSFYVSLICNNINSSLILSKYKYELNKLLFRGNFKFNIMMEYKGDIENGSFEGDLNHWIIPSTSSKLVTVVEKFKDLSPMEGLKFAVLNTEGEDSTAMMYQRFHGKKGTTLKGYSFFLSGDIPLFDNFAEIVLKNKSDSFEEIIFKASVNSTGNTPWSLWSYELNVEDDYILEARVKNQGDPIFQSVLALDGIHLLET